MILFDSHAHLYDRAYDADREDMIRQVREDISLVVCPSEDLETSRKSLTLAKHYDFVYAAVGIHPQRTGKATLADWEEIMHMAAANAEVKAIGEIGLDYYRMTSDKETQQEWFARQIEGAKELDLPIIIHDRDAHGDTLQMLKEHKDYRLRGIIHCYSGSLEMAREFIKLGFYISFAGPVVFPGSRRLKEVAREIPLDRLLIETDSPYLTPPPHRGERNCPCNVRYVAEEVAGLRGLSAEEVAKASFDNAKRIYGI